MTLTTRFLTLLLLGSSTMLLGCQSSIQPGAPTITRAAAAHYGQVPLSFEANQGQAKETVKFLARGTNATLYLTPSEAALEVRRPQPTTDHQPPATALVKMKLLGANAPPRLQGEQELPGKSNYFSGKDTTQWKTNIPTYRQVKYEQVYDGIDLVYYGNQQQLEYDFIVQPGANPNAIKFRLEGADEVTLNAAGELVLQTAAGEIKQRKPVIYQEVRGQRKEIAGNYVLTDEGISFAVSDYDVTQSLVIDPIIQWASYVAGQIGSHVEPITADKAGNLYLGVWDGPDATMGAYNNSGGYSVMKINPTGTAVVWTVRMGAGSYDRVFGMTLDKDNNVYLTGEAANPQYPITPGAFQTDFGITCGGCRNAFVTKLSADGTQLLYSTFLKGDQVTKGAGIKAIRGKAITVDLQGNAYVTGNTNVKDFPVTPNAIQATFNSDFEPTFHAFVTKLNPTGSALVYSTYLCSSGTEAGTGIAVDAQGQAFVTGMTGNGYRDSSSPQKTPFPRTPGAYQTPEKGGAFITKFDATGNNLIYSTIIGLVAASNSNLPIAIDSAGNAYIASDTSSSTFPTTPGAYKTSANPENRLVFITKLNSTGSALVYSTYLGKDNEWVGGLSVDAEGNATVVGGTFSPEFPQTDTPQAMPHPMGYITRLNSTGTKLLYSSLYIGGLFYGLADAGNGKYYMSGQPKPEFALTPNVFQTKGSGYIVLKVGVPGVATTVSAANYSGSPLASEAIVSTFGTGLATTTQSATSVPLPVTLGGTTVTVRDSGGAERAAALFFISPTQVNFQIPPGTANGNATITITAQDGAIYVSTIEIANVVPSLFSADTTGRGLAAAHAQRGGSLTFEPVVQFDFTKGQLVAVPIDLGGASEQVYLVLYGTGIRLRSSLSNVTATIGGVPATVSYAGAQPDFVGLDQVNILIPRSLIGRGLVDVVLNVEGKPANTLKVAIK